MTNSPEIIYDYCGLKCPLPVLKARRALKEASVGARLLILADDPAAPLDFSHFCETTGHHLIQSSEQDGRYEFIIEKSGA